MILQLGRAAGTAGADARALGQLFQGAVPPVDQGVPGVPSWQQGPQGQTLGHQGGHILEAVDRQVDLTRKQLLLDLFDEHAQTHSGQGRGGVAVALGGHDDQFKLQVGMVGAQLGDYRLGLPPGQRAAPAPHLDDVTRGHGPHPFDSALWPGPRSG